jgi:hypothetical protein
VLSHDQSYRILITGSGGIIGGHVLKLLGSGADRIEVIQFKGDLADMAQTQAAIDDAGPVDGIIHLGAMVAVGAVRADPAGIRGKCRWDGSSARGACAKRSVAACVSLLDVACLCTPPYRNFRRLRNRADVALWAHQIDGRDRGKGYLRCA